MYVSTTLDASWLGVYLLDAYKIFAEVFMINKAFLFVKMWLILFSSEMRDEKERPVWPQINVQSYVLYIISYSSRRVQCEVLTPVINQ